MSKAALYHNKRCEFVILPASLSQLTNSRYEMEDPSTVFKSACTSQIASSTRSKLGNAQ